MAGQNFGTWDLPAHWASALINGDESGLDADDIAALEAFTADMVEEFGQCSAVDCGGEHYEDFRRYHDASSYGVLACNVLPFTFDMRKV